MIFLTHNYFLYEFNYYRVNEKVVELVASDEYISKSPINLKTVYFKESNQLYFRAIQLKAFPDKFYPLYSAAYNKKERLKKERARKPKQK